MLWKFQACVYVNTQVFFEFCWLQSNWFITTMLSKFVLMVSILSSKVKNFTFISIEAKLPRVCPVYKII